MKVSKHDGEVIVVPAPTGGVVSGRGVRIGVMFGVAATNAAQTVPVALHVTGVYTLPKATGVAWTVGVRLFWDASNSNVSTVATGKLAIGVAEAAAASGDTSGRVRLSGAWGANAQEA
ncbi:MAG: DUF2190 family protein [Planctomycetaceae bacterium]|nr:DUF2190 family protein [Planctomycetaceae bacterium]